ncbi:pilin [Neisseria sp. Ec49-e6-T10]|uniref:pilin n=1 Tax=Neisseria sp. Ec49-e6-T10 TaxID=3140744 RepID=UPI003EBB7686
MYCKKIAYNQLKQQGFSLIELMVVIVIIVIVSALALPRYFDYISQTQVVRVYGELASVKSATDAALFSGKKPVTNSVPTNSVEEYIGYNASLSSLVSNFDIHFQGNDTFANVALVATLGESASLDVVGSVLVFSRHFDSETKIVDHAGWRCKYFKGGPYGAASGWNPKFTPAGCTAVNGVYTP